jgi:hypothetical protein
MTLKKNDRICMSCKKEFRYPSRLDKHLERKTACKTNNKSANCPLIKKTQPTYNQINYQEIKDQQLQPANILESNAKATNIKQLGLIELEKRLKDFDNNQINDIDTQECNENINICKYIHTTNNIKAINANKVCNKCNKVFLYKQSLIRHQRLNRCKSDDIEKETIAKILQDKEDMSKLIDKFCLENDNNVKLQIMMFLNKAYGHVQNVPSVPSIASVATKQIKKPISNIIGTIDVLEIIDESVQDEIVTSIYPKQKLPMTTANISIPLPHDIKAETVIINITNNNNNSNNWICNGIQMINPFTKENISFLKTCYINDLMKMNITDAIIDLVVKVYDREENQNFYKPNKSANDISFLDDKCRFNVCHQNQFHKKLYLNGLYLYLRVMHQFTSHNKTNAIIVELINNIKQYQELKKTCDKNTPSDNSIELYTKLKNICSSIIENDNSNTKTNTVKLRKALFNDKKVYEHFQVLCNNADIEFRKLSKDMQQNISDEQLIQTLGKLVDIDITDDDTIIKLKTQKYESTEYKKDFDTRRELETAFFTENPTLGNIFNLVDRLNVINTIEEQVQKFADEYADM